MKKAVLEDVMKIVVKDVPKPRPMSNEVLIKVHCCSFSFTKAPTTAPAANVFLLYLCIND